MFPLALEYVIITQYCSFVPSLQLCIINRQWHKSVVSIKFFMFIVISGHAPGSPFQCASSIIEMLLLLLVVAVKHLSMKCDIAAIYISVLALLSELRLSHPITLT